MFRRLVPVLLVLAASAARAECPDVPGWQPLDMMQPGDTWLDAYWLHANLAGHRVHYDGGDEYYLPGGRYRFDSGGQSWAAPGYRFYDNGARCIDYPDGPRVDYYIISNGRLTLINAQGERFTGLLTD